MSSKMRKRIIMRKMKKNNMKHLKTFESFQLNEGIFDNIKKGVKNLFSMIDLSKDIRQKIKSLGYSDIYTTALEWIEKCGYDVSDVWSWNDTTITIGLEGLKAINSALIGVRLEDGKIKVGSSPSDLKVCNGPDELKSLVDAISTTEKERKQKRKRLEKESLEALERSRKWRKPEKVTKEVWDSKLRHGKVPFTKKETEFFQKFKEKNENKKRKIDLGKIGESDTISIKSRDNGCEYYKYIIKLDDEWYAIKSGYYEMVVDVTNVVGDLHGNDHYEEYFVCDEFEEVLGYLERKDSYYFPDELNSRTEIDNNTNANDSIRSLEDGYELEDEDEEDEEEYYDNGFSNNDEEDDEWDDYEDYGEEEDEEEEH